MSQTFTFPVEFQQPVTASQGLTGTFYGDGSNLTGASLPGQESVNTTVQSNSGNWNSAYTNVNSNSANWNTAYQNISGNLTLNNTVLQQGETLTESISSLIINVNGQQYKIPLLPI